jgi:hypothetical protein
MHFGLTLICLLLQDELLHSIRQQQVVCLKALKLQFYKDASSRENLQEKNQQEVKI